MTTAVLIYGCIVAVFFAVLYCVLAVWAARELQKPDTRREERRRLYDEIFKAR